MQCVRPLRKKISREKKDHDFGLEHRTVTKITFLKRREKFQSTHTSLDRKYSPAEKFSKSAEADFLGSFKHHFWIFWPKISYQPKFQQNISAVKKPEYIPLRNSIEWATNVPIKKFVIQTKLYIIEIYFFSQRSFARLGCKRTQVRMQADTGQGLSAHRSGFERKQVRL